MAVSSRLQRVKTMSEEPMDRVGMNRSRRKPESSASMNVSGRFGRSPRGGGGCQPREGGDGERGCHRPVRQSTSEVHAFVCPITPILP